ncbi:nucleoside/nucleotide kinase family protein [Solwaraspora sp. WMMD791]|uniref:nucleoside/nucleotide kinase family protein n=1 Tax=Solwaraspora sp. WMMD791 TaxID=3016086 RepID=UPI00249C9C1E|nr:nucleoside/nucleotide kinase family protein [Solwaraspora sp. WMMD791]WFE28705.1 nucleoside/nucleotide kinase family protein [Solwaraspora sp. WMMD791]
MLVELVAHARRLVPVDGRHVLGITGCPAAGKSTLALALAQELARHGDAVAAVPMDGFHLSDSALHQLGRRDRKGAIDTFDADGYLALLRRIRADRDRTIWAPGFARDLEQPIAGTIPVDPQVRLVVTEGNYLLAEDPPWPQIRAELVEVWYCHLDDDLRRDRLVRRHIEFGKSEQAARDWVRAVDDPNAALISSSRDRADLDIDMARIGPLGPTAG